MGDLLLLNFLEVVKIEKGMPDLLQMTIAAFLTVFLSGLTDLGGMNVLHLDMSLLLEVLILEPATVMVQFVVVIRSRSVGARSNRLMMIVVHLLAETATFHLQHLAVANSHVNHCASLLVVVESHLMVASPHASRHVILSEKKSAAFEKETVEYLHVLLPVICGRMIVLVVNRNFNKGGANSTACKYSCYDGFRDVLSSAPVKCLLLFSWIVIRRCHLEIVRCSGNSIDFRARARISVDCVILRTLTQHVFILFVSTPAA